MATEIIKYVTGMALQLITTIQVPHRNKIEELCEFLVIHDYICNLLYNKSIKGFGWNKVGPASWTVAQHYFTFGPMYRVIRVVAF